MIQVVACPVTHATVEITNCKSCGQFWTCTTFRKHLREEANKVKATGKQ